MDDVRLLARLAKAPSDDQEKPVEAICRSCLACTKRKLEVVTGFIGSLANDSTVFSQPWVAVAWVR